MHCRNVCRFYVLVVNKHNVWHCQLIVGIYRVGWSFCITSCVKGESHIITSSFARFATCRHRRIWHVAAVHLCNISRHAPIRSIRTMDCQGGWSWEQHSVCGDRWPKCTAEHVMQQSTCYYFPFAFHNYAFISTTSTVTILCTCPIMHDKVIHLLLFALLKHSTMRIPSDNP